MWPSRFSGTHLIALCVSSFVILAPLYEPLHAEENPASANAVPSAANAVPSTAEAASLEQMRREMDELKAQVRALREQIDLLRRGAGGAPTLADVPAQPPPPALTIPAAPPPPRPLRAAGAGLLNPAISAVFEGIGGFSVNHNRDDDGFSLSEAEIGIQAAVDPFARVDLFLAFGSEGDAEVEEGFVTFTALPGGLAARAGRFKNTFGKWNELHDHRFFSVDRPEVLSNTFGDEGLRTDGVSLSWLVPGTGPVYLESITEIGSTGNDVVFNARRRDLLYLQRVAAVFTLTANATLGVGVTGVKGVGGPSEELLDELDDAGLTGVVVPDDNLASNVFGADLTFKWKPVQFNVYRSFTSQTELLETRRRVETLEPSGLLDRRTVRSLGVYSLAEYQFAKRWRVGLRYDHSEFPDNDGAWERGASAVIRIQPTEFQEFRIQFKHTGRSDAAAALFDDINSENEWFVEWIPAIGAHAAHKY